MLKLSKTIKFVFCFVIVVLACIYVYADEIFVSNHFGSNINDHEVFLKRVQFDSKYFLGVDGYYSIAPKVIERSEQRSKIEQLIELIKNEKNPEVKKSLIDVLKKLLDCALEDNNNNNKPSKPDEPEKPEDFGDNLPNPEQNPDGPSKLDLKVFDLFVKKCAKCHKNDNNGITLVKDKNGDGEYDTLVLHDLPNRVEIYDRVFGVDLEKRGKARMPKGKPLTDEEVKLLYLWMIEESDRVRDSEE